PGEEARIIRTNPIRARPKNKVFTKRLMLDYYPDKTLTNHPAPSRWHTPIRRDTIAPSISR
ncbi:hypothetical protein, partial [Gilvimarinus xylanilyticus]